VTDFSFLSSKCLGKEGKPLEQQQDLEEWFDEYGQAIVTYILLIVRDYPLAEDLTQETFLKAFKNRHQYRGDASVKTWLFSIAQNTTKDYFKKRNPLKYYLNLSFDEQDDRPLPEQVILMHDTTEHLYHAIGSLKLPYKQVITLRKIKEFSTEETAIILNWSESKVKMTLKRALVALKEELINWGSYDEFFRREF